MSEPWAPAPEFAAPSATVRPEYCAVDEPKHCQHRQSTRVDAGGTSRILLFQVGELNGKADAKQQAEHAVELAGEQHVADGLRNLIQLPGPLARAIGFPLLSAEPHC